MSKPTEIELQVAAGKMVDCANEGQDYGRSSFALIAASGIQGAGVARDLIRRMVESGDLAKKGAGSGTRYVTRRWEERTKTVAEEAQLLAAQLKRLGVRCFPAYGSHGITVHSDDCIRLAGLLAGVEPKGPR